MNDKDFEKQVDNALNAIRGLQNIFRIKLTDKIETLEQEIEDLKKQHEQALNEAYDKGYNDAVSDHTKLLM